MHNDEKGMTAAVARSGAEVSVLHKALFVIEYLTRTEGYVGLKEMSKETGIPKTTLLRILTTLKDHRMVQQDPVTKMYQLGWAPIYIGSVASQRFDLIKTLHPFLERLSHETGESASLVRLQKDNAIYVDQVSCNNIIRSGLGIGAHIKIHISAAGKVLLGGMADSEIHRFIKDNPLTKYSENTITCPKAFYEEILKVREQGYALDNEEGELGACCIAAPIQDWSGSIVAAISITGPTSRISEEARPQLIKTVRRVAAEASHILSTCD